MQIDFVGWLDVSAWLIKEIHYVLNCSFFDQIIMSSK